MADVSTAVRRLQIETTVKGASDAKAQLGQLNAAYQDSTKASSDAQKASAGYEGQLAAMQRQSEAMMRAQLAQNAALQANTAALQNASRSMVAANDNTARSFAGTGLEVAEMANHLRTVATAAYAFSPAFRGVVNEMAAPALRGAGIALVAVAGGLVTATNIAGTGLVRLGTAAAGLSPSLAPVAAGVTAAGAAMQAFSPSLAGVATSIVSKLMPALRLLGPIGVAVNVIKTLGDAWELGGQKLEEYRQIAERAAKVDLSTTYFQKLTKGAEDAKVPVDALITALTNLEKASSDRLGGSALQNRLDASVKAGNFSGNTGVQEFAQANTTQQRYEAIVSLINQAMTAGQRLAALDIAGTAFGPEVADNLRKDSEYLDKIKAAADKIAEKDLVSPEDIGRAVDLQNRYDAAVKILEQRWHPIQDLLTQAGVEFHANWVATVETMAQAFDWVAKMVAKLGEVPPWFQRKLNEGAQSFMEATTSPESRKAAEQSLGISSDPGDMARGTDAYSIAVNKLRAGLQDQAEQQRRVSEANTIAQKNLGDTSHAIDGQKKATEEANDAYDRALESVTKHTARLQADAQAVGLGAGALEEFRARTQLVTAAQLSGREMTAELTAEIDRQAKAAGAAGAELAKLKIQNQINFDRATIGLSPEDVQIASALKQIYPDVTKALASTEAADMRLNNQMRVTQDAINKAGSAAFDFGNNLVQAFASGKSGLDALLPALSSFGSTLTSIGTDSLKSGISGMLKGLGTSGFDPASLGIGAAGLGISLISNLIGGDAKKRAELEAAQNEWKKAGPAFQKFLTEMSGGAQGDIAATFQQNFQTAYGLAVQADKAGDRAAVTRIYEAEGRNAIDQSKKFLSTFDAALQGMTDGLGANSPFLVAVNNVKSQLTTVQKFVDDARVAAGAVVGGVDLTTGETLAGARPEQLAVIADATSRATTAAESYLVSLLQAAPVLSTVQTALLNVNGTAAALQTSLVQLGMSSESAAAEIQNGLNKALDAIKAQFEESLTERLNTANGAGYLNDAAALVKQHAQDISDAAALGLSQDQVAAVFHAEAQKIVDDAGLVGDSFSDFITLFPDFNGVVNQSATALAAATQKVQAFVKSLNDYLNGLAVGTNSTLSPQQQLASAQSSFSDQFNLAKGGNEDALNTITQYASAYLDQAKSFYASSSGYSDIYNQVTSALKELPAALGATDSSTKIVAAINTTAAQSDELQAQQNALAQQQASYLLVQNQLLGAINGLSDRTVAAMNGVGSLMAAIANGFTEQYRQMVSLLQQQVNAGSGGGGGSLWSWLGFQAGGRIPGFADGGMVGNGIYNVDSVLARYAGGGNIALAGGEYVNRATSVNAATLPTLQYINDNGRLPSGGDDSSKQFAALANTLVRAMAGVSMTEISAMREEQAALRAEISRLTRAVEANKPPAPRAGTRDRLAS